MGEQKPNDSRQTEATVETESKDLQTQINEALNNVDDNGKVLFSDDIDPLFKAAVMATRDSRFYQADHTKSRQELAKVNATNQVLNNRLESTTQLSAEQVEELEDLKHVNPDEWFSKKTQYETEARTLARVCL